MTLTSEQASIIAHIKANEGLTSIDAVAGAGKTTTLVEIAKAVSSQNGLYLAYNKAIATEASRKFPNEVHCCTTHSLAYRAIVSPNKLKVGFLSYRDLPYDMPYDYRVELIELFRKFCLSNSLCLASYLAEREISEDDSNLLVGIAESMAAGKRDCTHDFYLKMFHIYLATNRISYDEFDLIMLDEAGDLNPVTLEIFKLLPAKRKVMVGDPYQNIYAFNHTINCFDEMADEGMHLKMSKSFRVNAKIASSIESFMQSYVDPDMKFEGVPTNKSIKTRAFIARTNASLIDKMMKLNLLGIPYGLTRTPNQIFELPNIIRRLRPGGSVSNPEYKYLQEAADEYASDKDLRKRFKSQLGYLRSKYATDVAVSSAISVLMHHSVKGIAECYEEAKKHQSTNQPYILGTSHSMKGLEADEVTLANDLNTTAGKALAKCQSVGFDNLSKDDQTELYLYYVACSRARKELNNATLL